MTHLALHFLGPLKATVDAEPIAASRAKKIEALLAYLAVESGRPHRRETLVGLLFPDMPDDQARTNLRQTLSRLRRTIRDKDAEPPFLIVTREDAQFNRASDYFLDIEAFETGLQGCDEHRRQRSNRCLACMQGVQEAINQYRGPFLDGFYLEESLAFDDWLLAHRERLGRLALDALTELVQFHERRGDYASAEQAARRQIGIEPWREEPHRQLMRLLAYQGRRSAALHQYAQLRETLWNELGVEPSPQTAALREQIASLSDGRPHNLPPRDPAFVGRAEEIGLVHQRLAAPECRLLTLVGSGGSGKTALASEVGWRVALEHVGPFPQGAYFVPLAGVSAAGSDESGLNPVVTAAAEALGFTFSGSRPPREQLADYLQDKSLLLIFDNFEHLIASERDVVRWLLSRTNALQILVTSRERLNVAEEWTVSVGGLPVSDQATQLFVQRARRVVAGFALGEADHQCTETAVAAICRLIHGLPLGIELAASWVRMLSCPEIAQEIQHSVDFLQTSLHDAPPRHQSLRAVFDYSWNLLNTGDRRVLRQLAVFRGPFDRDAAQTVTQASLPALTALVDRSLLQRRDGPGGVQYELLEVVRQYAAEKLAEAGTEETAVRTRHAHHYLGWLRTRAPALRSLEQQVALTELVQRIENLRTAWAWTVRQGDAAALDDGLDALSQLYYMRSWFPEGTHVFEQAAQRLAGQHAVPTTAALWPRLIVQQGWFTFLEGRTQAGRDLLEQGLERLRAAGDAPALAQALNYLAVATYTLGDPVAAQAPAQEALAISEAAGDRAGTAVANNVLSQIAYLRGDYAAARRHSEASLTLEQATGNRWSMGFSLTNLGRAAYAQGDYAAAESRFREGLAIREALEDRRGQALCWRYLGDTAVAQDDLSAAAAAYARSRAFFRDIGSQASVAAVSVRLGRVAQAAGEPDAQLDNLTAEWLLDAGS